MPEREEATPHAEPPEGAIVGENVPPDSEPDGYDEQRISEMMNRLRSRGEGYREMSDAVLRERALDLIDDLDARE